MSVTYLIRGSLAIKAIGADAILEIKMKRANGTECTLTFPQSFDKGKVRIPEDASFTIKNVAIISEERSDAASDGNKA